jgi:predicted transcriptional regulator
MLDQYLKQLGFSEKEIAIYLCIVEGGKLSASTVARITRVNRTTVYSVTKELIKKGVITEDLGGTNRYYTALPIEELRNLYKTEEKELQEKKIAIEHAIAEMESLPKGKKYSVPKIRFIDEIHLKDFLFKQLPTWIESAKNGDHNWWGFQDASLLAEYPEWNEYHWKLFPKEYGTKLFTNKKSVEQEIAEKYGGDERRQVKYWNLEKDFTATHAVLGDYIFFCITNEHPHYLVEIHDAVMADNLREMFKGMWNKI